MSDIFSWYAITHDFMQPIYKWKFEGEYRDKKFELEWRRNQYSQSWTVLYLNDMVRVFGFIKYKDAMAFAEQWAKTL